MEGRSRSSPFSASYRSWLESSSGSGGASRSERGIWCRLRRKQLDGDGLVDLHGLFKLVDRHPFIGLMELVYAPGTADDHVGAETGSDLGAIRGVAHSADGRLPATTGSNRFDRGRNQNAILGGLNRRGKLRDLDFGSDRNVSLQLRHDAFDCGQNLVLVLAGHQSHVHVDGTAVGDDVGLDA